MYGLRGADEIPIPDWARPYLAIALALIALVMLASAIGWSARAYAPARQRWGSAAAFAGFFVMLTVLACAIGMDLNLMPWPLAVCVASGVAIGVGGSLAGWQRR